MGARFRRIRKYSTIEIELIPIENEKYRKGKFINIKGEKQFYIFIYILMIITKK